MYQLILYLHSYIRWAVLLTLLYALARAVRGWRSGQDFGPSDRKAGLWATVVMDLQFLIGLALYAGLSPLTKAAFSNFAAAMRTRTLRFWAVEHLSLVVLSIIVLHAGRIWARRARIDRVRHRRLTISYGLTLLLVLAAIPWPFMIAVGRPWFRF